MKVTDAMKQAMREADPNESNVSIGKRLGIGDGHVSYYRTKFRNESKSTKPSQKKDASAPPFRWTASSQSGAANTAQATFLVTDKIVDNWWKGLTLGDKAAIFSSNYVIRVEGSVQ